MNNAWRFMQLIWGSTYAPSLGTYGEHWERFSLWQGFTLKGYGICIAWPPDILKCRRVTVTVSPLCESTNPVDILVSWNWFISQSPRKVRWLLRNLLLICTLLWPLIYPDRFLNPQRSPTGMFVDRIPIRLSGSPTQSFYLLLWLGSLAEFHPLI